MDYIRKEQIRIKISLIVLLIDDFTNEIILSKHVSVRIEGEQPPIIKNGGYYIFTNLLNQQYTVEMSAFNYQTQIINVNLENFDQEIPIIKVRLIPNKNYVFPENTTSIYGIAAPEQAINIICRKNQKPIRILYDYKKKNGKSIFIFNPFRLNLDSKSFYIEDDQHHEIFTTDKELEKDEYILKDELKYEYMKANTKVYFIFQTIGDSEGNYLLPLSNIEKKEDENVMCELLSKDKIVKKFSIEYGKRCECKEVE